MSVPILLASQVCTARFMRRCAWLMWDVLMCKILLSYCVVPVEIICEASLCSVDALNVLDHKKRADISARFLVKCMIDYSRNLASKRKNSRYSQNSVTTKPKAPYHSMYFGAPAATPFSMKSKSSTRFKAAIVTTNKLNAMPTQPLP